LRRINGFEGALSGWLIFGQAAIFLLTKKAARGSLFS
jgi:hypothetical protein